MANSLFFIGSIMWIVSACVCDAANATNDWGPCQASALLATSCFFVDALCYFAAWWAMKRAGRENPFGSSLMAQQSRGWRRALQRIDYLFWGNVMFFVGTGLDFTTSYFSYSSASLDAPQLARITYVLSMLLWMGYASMEIVRALLNITNRRALSCAVVVSFHVSSSPAALRKLGFGPNVNATVFPWDLIGAILFQLASMFYMTAALVCWSAESFSCLPFELCGAVLFLFNSIVLFIDDGVSARYHRVGIYDLCAVDAREPLETRPILALDAVAAEADEADANRFESNGGDNVVVAVAAASDNNDTREEAGDAVVSLLSSDSE